MPSDPPSKPSPVPATAKANVAATLIALTGLVAAVGALVRPRPEDAARAGYMELTAAILEVQETEKKNHEDVAALRMYLDTYVRSHEVIVTPIPAAIATATSAAASPSPSPRPADTSLPTPTRALAVAPPSAPSPPPVAPMAAPKRMRSEADIAW